MAALEPTTDHDEIQTWAARQQAVPIEQLPHRVDGLPAILSFMSQAQTVGRLDVRLLSWEEFFLKFDALGLTFVYDEGMSGQNEILQIEEKSPYKPSGYKKLRSDN